MSTCVSTCDLCTYICMFLQLQAPASSQESSISKSVEVGHKGVFIYEYMVRSIQGCIKPPKAARGACNVHRRQNAECH